jgi:ammonium transporter, Amt family
VNYLFGTNKDFYVSSGFKDIKAHPNEDIYLNFLFSLQFAATASTIVSGSLAERARILGYIIFSIYCNAIICPVVMYWTWCSNGWLYNLGFVDFAGCGAVHMVGGISGAIGAYILKPRLGVHGETVKFEQIENFTEYKLKKIERKDQPAFEKWFKKEVNHFDERPHNLPFVVIATMLLWVCWLFFNGGSVSSIFNHRKVGSSKIMMNTTISGASGGVVA